jgi:dienelactone hydrolase
VRLAALAILLTLPTLTDAAEAGGWTRLRVPGFWERQFGGTLDGYDGFAWYRCFVRIPQDWANTPLTLELGRIDDCDETFVNGTRVGASGSIQPFRTASSEERRYPLPAGAVRPGSWNLIAVRVWDNGGAGGIGAGRQQISNGATTLSLQGQWEFRTGDDPAWARLPPEENVARLGQAFAANAGTRFGHVVETAPLAGTAPLTLEGDIASHLVDGVDRFLLREIDRSVDTRPAHWHRDFSGPDAYSRSIETNRQRLAHIIGARDPRPTRIDLEVIAGVGQSPQIATAAGYEILPVRWPAFGDVHGEGLLLQPTGRAPVANIVAIPDAGQSPEQIAGLAEGVIPGSQYARHLAAAGCRVLVPMVINRNMGPHLGRANLTAREFLYRPAFELGRHLIGYEVQKVLAAVDWFRSQNPGAPLRTAVVGWGEGGLLALYAGAMDPRIDAVCVSGYFNDRRQVWQEPIDRNIFGLFEQFGDAELASMIAPRPLVVEAAMAPEIVVTGKGGGAPARLATPPVESVRAELERARKLTASLAPTPRLDLVVSGDGTGPFLTQGTLSKLLDAMAAAASPVPQDAPPHPLRSGPDAAARQKAQLHEIDRHNQALLVDSPNVRQEFMKRLDTRSLDAYRQTVEPYRKFFYDEVVGRFDHPLLPPSPRSRRTYDEEKWVGYEVVLDVFPDVIAYGILLLPRDLKPGERRPVVVCQHGLEGRPQDIVSGDHEAYHDFAARLAERGFITFAPQNLYIFTDRFRSLQRKSNPLKKTLFSTIVPQHQQIVNWLQTLPFVDPARIGFYGLSYGGKSAMRIPPLVPQYAFSICSADFNEWVSKNAATAGTIGRYAYVWGGEYEIFEFDLGSTFNYAEMAALIAPRPFMVERGHFDGVAPDETVAYEFAKVKFLYDARLKIGDRCEMETFVGPHTINGKGTFDFVHKHLQWPKP